MKIQFTVLGEPQGKGRPKFSRIPNGGVQTRTPDKTVLYENLIVTEYRRQCKGMRFLDGEMLDLRVMAYYTIPSTSKKKKAAMVAGEIRPTKKPDADNIVKAVADALNTVAYKDDSQIVDCQIRKFYSEQPRIVVTILTVN